MNGNRTCVNCIYFDACGDFTRTMPCKGRVTERDQKIETIEDMILTMADIIHENRQLKYELEKAKHYEKEYTKLLTESITGAHRDVQNLMNLVVNEKV